MAFNDESTYLENYGSFGPWVRLAMVCIAQLIGFVLLVSVGFGVFDAGKEEIARGLNFIKAIMTWYGILSACILVPVVVIAVLRGRLTQGFTDVVLIGYVIVDSILVLLLVCQEGGLCRSPFLPVYFLIPIAYFIVERREKTRYRWRRIAVLLGIIGCICKSHAVALQLQPTSESGIQPVSGTVFVSIWPLQVTDFTLLAHPSFEKALFWVSLITGLVPIAQILVVLCVDRIKKMRAENATQTPIPETA